MTTYFIHLSIERENQESYVFKTYEAEDYEVAKDKFDAICSGKEDDIPLPEDPKLAVLKGPYATVVFIIELTLTEFDEDGFPASNRLLNSCKIVR